MALQEFAGSASLEIDGVEVEVATVTPNETTGRRPVRTMNRLRQIAGFARGIKTYELRVGAVIPLGPNRIDWANIEGAKLTLAPGDDGTRTSYLDCFSTDIGEEYREEGEARINITLIAVRKVQE